MAPAQKRRKEDEKLTPSWIVSAAKATVAFISFGILSFIGSWGIDVSKSVAQLKEQMALVQQQQTFLGPWFSDSIKEIKEGLKDMRAEQKVLNSEVQRISNEQLRRKPLIDKISEAKENRR